MADDLDIDLIPLFQEDEDTVAERNAADLNAGIDSTSDEWTDDRPGSMHQIVSRAIVSEQARLWDGLSNDVPSVAFPTRAWGDWLDEWASVFGMYRNSAVKATGIVLFTGVAQTIIPAQTVLSAIQSNPNVEPPEFVTTGDGVQIPNEIVSPSGMSSVAVAGGVLVDATSYKYMVTALNEAGETLASAETSATTADPNKAITVTWDPVTGATEYKVYRSTTAGSGTKRYLATVVSPTYTDAAQDMPNDDILVPTENTTTGHLLVPIEASEEGVAGNVGAGAISSIQTGIIGITDVINPDPTLNGAEIEDDEQLRQRILLKFRGENSGNQAQYAAWALAWPGVGKVTVIPRISGPGTVGVIIMNASGDPLGSDIVDGLQYLLDPLPGQGAGLAPIDHTVIVTTPTHIMIDVVAVMEFEEGYSLDGVGGTVALRMNIVNSISQYIDQLEAGEDVVYGHVQARIFNVDGVYRVTSCTVEGGTADVTINNDYVAALAVPVLS